MSRSNARSRRLRHRPSRVVPASIVAVVLLAVGVLAAIAAITRLVNGTWPVAVTSAAAGVAGLTWGSAVAIAAGAVVAVVGLVLMIAGLKPGTFRTARLEPSSNASAAAETDFVISTRAIARLSATRADLVDGVDKVSVSATGRRVNIEAATTSEQADQIRVRIIDGVTQTLTAAGLHPVPTVTARARMKGI